MLRPPVLVLLLLLAALVATALAEEGDSSNGAAVAAAESQLTDADAVVNEFHQKLEALRGAYNVKALSLEAYFSAASAGLRAAEERVLHNPRLTARRAKSQRQMLMQGQKASPQSPDARARRRLANCTRRPRQMRGAFQRARVGPMFYAFRQTPQARLFLARNIFKGAETFAVAKGDLSDSDSSSSDSDDDEEEEEEGGGESSPSAADPKTRFWPPGYFRTV